MPLSCLRACLGARLLPQSYQYPNLSEGADRVGGQMRGDRECPFSDVTKSGRVWRKEPENGARSVGQLLTHVRHVVCPDCHVTLALSVQFHTPLYGYKLNSTV